MDAADFTATRELATWYAVMGESTPDVESWVAACLTDFVDDYDVPAIVAEFRSQIADVLPEGVGLIGSFFYARLDVDTTDLDLRGLIESVDFWAIAERHDRAAN